MTKSLGTVHDEIGDDDPGPCSPNCPSFRRCAREAIACAAFASFVARDKRWESRSRIPLSETYFRVYAVPA